MMEDGGDAPSAAEGHPLEGLGVSSKHAKRM